ncbi:hypothetical protein BDN70DRAFT_734635 [Pholiota conissans]|uniref:Uncharacterized protein n=1 Tax=Pholiota conissans TaxID=109636 RepID=A0A9P6CKQ6_9AGAR|nr:hypothetical protein BDN70DRAFT_734635 [Pholiota conissans]
MDAESCISVVRKELSKKNVEVEGIDDSTSVLYNEMKEIIRDMSELNDWGNARDMITLSKDLINLALRQPATSGAQLQILGSEVLDVMNKLLIDRQRRSKIASKPARTSNLPQQTFAPTPPTPPAVSTGTDTQVSKEPDPTPDRPQTPQPRSATPSSSSDSGRGSPRGRRRGRGTGRNLPNVGRLTSSNSGTVSSDPQRDPGVSDAVWQQLNDAKRAAEEAERKTANEIHRLKRAAEERKAKEAQEKKALEDLEKAAAAEKEAQRRAELLRQRELARLKAHAERVAREQAEAALLAKEKAERERRAQEERAQQKLRELGVCPAGFRWQNMGSYYLCGGGSHTVTTASLGL